MTRERDIFFQNRKTWTAETRKAWDFQHVDHAIQVAADIRLDQVEVVLWFDDPKDELRLPVKIVAPLSAAKTQTS